jgi:hypothetical protein
MGMFDKEFEFGSTDQTVRLELKAGPSGVKSMALIVADCAPIVITEQQLMDITAPALLAWAKAKNAPPASAPAGASGPDA